MLVSFDHYKLLQLFTQHLRSCCCVLCEVSHYVDGLLKEYHAQLAGPQCHHCIIFQNNIFIITIIVTMVGYNSIANYLNRNKNL